MTSSRPSTPPKTASEIVHEASRRHPPASGSTSTTSIGASSSHPDIASGTDDDMLPENRDSTLPAPVPGTRRRLNWWNWNWVPAPVRRTGNAVATWVRGPPNPTRYTIKPLLPKVQHAPIWLVNKVAPRRWHKAVLALIYVALWVTAFALVVQHAGQTTAIEDFGVPTSLGCGSAYWVYGNGCGLDGNYCRPFANQTLAFKCPANCASYRVQNPRAVGDQEIIYQSMVIGGPGSGQNPNLGPIYRADSYICAAAMHSGIVSNTNGGCGVLNLIGEQRNFVSSNRNGIDSIKFKSSFPRSYTFLSGIACDSEDLRWPLLGMSVAFTALFSLFTTSVPLFFFAIFTGIFWHVGMVSDPPPNSGAADLASQIIGRYLPAIFVAWVMYDRMGVRRTLVGLTAQVEKTILWLGACWLGALENYSFSEWIPINRLTGRDLDQQPGAKAALAFIVILLVVIAASQVWFFRQEGRLGRMLRIYGLLVGAILICLCITPLELRIHHYILALLLLPGTSMQTRPSLVYQGLLVGLFINGTARWGFDAVLQTAAALLGDGQFFSDLPTILAPTISLASASSTNLSSITFSWSVADAADLGYDGISVLVNDVERYRGFFEDKVSPDPNVGGPNAGRRFEWRRNATTQPDDEYFRFAYVFGTDSMDYTKAGTWTAAGEWVTMAPGPSKMRRRSLTTRSPKRNQGARKAKRTRVFDDEL